MGEARQHAADGPGIAPVLRWPTPKSRTWTANFLDSVAKDVNVVAVIAVGSAVRPGVSSADLDLVVLCRHPEKLKDKPPIEIDMRTYATADVEALVAGGNDLLGWAITYGKALFERDQFWERIRKSWHKGVPLPSVDLTLQRAEKSYRRFREMLELHDYDAAHEQAVSYLTHLARAVLLTNGTHPPSRPELPGALRALGNVAIADALQRLLQSQATPPQELRKVLERVKDDQDPQPTAALRSRRNSAHSRTTGRKR